jgi:type IV pilus assembly protein PilX
MTIPYISVPKRSLGLQAGVSLIIVLIMLVIIGLTSAAAIRNATSGEKATNNIRLQNLAQQYAEAALRYCEAELRKSNDVDAPVGRKGTKLIEANIITVVLGGATGWEQTASWLLNSGGASASRTSVPESQIKSSNSAFKPTKLPECVVERQTMDDGNLAYVITARGFSPDYTADNTTGQTTNGSVVWLQSTVLLE